MENIENLRHTKSIYKIKAFVEKTDVCVFTTGLSETSASRPMSTAKVDENGDLWFFSKADWSINKQIAYDDLVRLIYSHSATSKSLTLYGRAQITTNKQKINELWNPLAKLWFEGKDDPSITLIKVSIEDCY